MPPINVVPREGLTISYGLRTVEIRDSKWDDVRVALFLRNPTWMSMRTPRTDLKTNNKRVLPLTVSLRDRRGEIWGADP